MSLPTVPAVLDCGSHVADLSTITPSVGIFNENWVNSFLILRKSEDLLALLQQLRAD